MNRDLFFIIFIFGIFSEAVLAEYKSSAPWVGQDFKGRFCEGESMHYGPFDYTNLEHRRTKLPIVEQYHFTSETESLVPERKGTAMGQVDIGGVEYTLTAFPNHHKALITMVRYGNLFAKELKSGQMKGIHPASECYFQRAINFSREDVISYLLYARYLSDFDMNDKAKILYEKALNLEPDNAVLHYNFGLFLLKRGEYKEARKHADIARKFGHPGVKLSSKLDSLKE